MNFDPTNPNLKKLVEALKSEEFEQATNSLRIGNCFCCLGVACELYRREHPKTSHWDRAMFSVENQKDVFALPRIVASWFGIKGRDIELKGKMASRLNDEGYTFKYIADQIESFLKESQK